MNLILSADTISRESYERAVGFQVGFKKNGLSLGMSNTQSNTPSSIKILSDYY